MGNITPNLQMKTLTFTEVNLPEVTDSKKSQARSLPRQLHSLCSKLGPEGYTNRIHGGVGRGAAAVCVQSTDRGL